MLSVPETRSHRFNRTRQFALPRVAMPGRDSSVNILRMEDFSRAAWQPDLAVRTSIVIDIGGGVC
jgi:hypothetical protein